VKCHDVTELGKYAALTDRMAYFSCVVMRSARELREMKMVSALYTFFLAKASMDRQLFFWYLDIDSFLMGKTQ
jgi:hypothetical protein